MMEWVMGINICILFVSTFCRAFGAMWDGKDGAKIAWALMDVVCIMGVIASC